MLVDGDHNAVVVDVDGLGPGGDHDRCLLAWLAPECLVQPEHAGRHDCARCAVTPAGIGNALGNGVVGRRRLDDGLVLVVTWCDSRYTCGSLGLFMSLHRGHASEGMPHPLRGGRVHF